MNTFLLPDLGEGLTEAEIVRWLVKVGDVIAVDTPIAEVETAKSIVELPSPYAGVIEELHGEPGTTVPVGKPLITVGDPAAAAYRAEERAGSGNVLVGYGTVESSGAGRRRKPRVSGTNPAPVAEKVPERRVPLVISPLVRRLARDGGVDLHELTGSGPDGLIVRRDVEHAIAFRAQQQPTAEQLTAEQLTAQQPTAEQSTLQRPTVEHQLTAEQLTAQRPTAEQSTAQQLTAEQSTVQRPTAEHQLPPE
ncbi:MAG: 2-oxo acid dehydrogenase subunit E2, partial [Kribbellaceae bacterium]|nr:2-oxo acid dehydrogenase subunit E2 [Kribbellaceae bacterium]